MASSTDPRSPALLLDSGLDRENGNASTQNLPPTPKIEPSHRSKYATHKPIIFALGVCVGIIGCLALEGEMKKQTGHGLGTAMANAFVATPAKPVAMLASAQSAFPQPQMMVGKEPKPLSPGSNYPTTKNIQTQKSGFGTWLQKFQTVDKKSKYGVPIYLPSGNVNPAYLKKEREEMQKKSKLNIKAAEAKRKKLISKKEFELADFIRKKIGNVGARDIVGGRTTNFGGRTR